MKTYFKLIVVFVVVGALLTGYVLLATGQKKSESSDAIQQETYMSEVIIQAPWGEKNLWYDKEESNPGKFGIHFTGEGPPVTPSGFTVAPNGDIYINDGLNKRVQRFGPTGELISVIHVRAVSLTGPLCADKDNNIYIYISYPHRPSIDKYDQAGNLLRSYPIEIYGKRKRNGGMETRGLQGIYCDNPGKVFMKFYYNYHYRDEETGSPKDIDWDGICQVGNAERVFSFEEQENTIRKHGFLGSNSAALSKGYFRAGGGNIYLVSFAGDTIKTYRSIEGSFFGCDENLNIYTQRIPSHHFYAHEYDRRKHAPVVRKYNSKGELITTFPYWCDKPYNIPAGGGEFLDSKGNIYVFCESYKDGIKVTKWCKK